MPCIYGKVVCWLFSIFINGLVNELAQHDVGIQFPTGTVDRLIQLLLYADDIVLVAREEMAIPLQHRSIKIGGGGVWLSKATNGIDDVTGQATDGIGDV